MTADIKELRKVTADCYWPTSPVAINELLDRLEEAKTAWKEADKACRDLTEKVIPNLRERLEVAEKERDALRAKIDAMERQEPVAWLHESRRDSDVVTSAVKHVWGKAATGSMAAYSIPLYLAPGAKGEGNHERTE